MFEEKNSAQEKNHSKELEETDTCIGQRVISGPISHNSEALDKIL